MQMMNGVSSSNIGWRGVRQLVAALGTLCLVAAGCGGQSGTDNAASPTGASNGGASNDTAASSSTQTSTSSADAGKPITIAYSDWPGWVVWDVVQQKGFFKKYGVNVKMVWFPVYTDSLNALSAGQVDANCQTWSDTMAPLAQGVDLKTVLVNDNSFGNDSLIAQPGITSLQQLKGKKVATELGTVDHFLLLKALEVQGMTEKDIQFTNIKVQDCPTAMLSKNVDAAVVWEPSRTKILSSMKGTKEIYTSRQLPGQIPDLLVAKGDLVKNRPGDVQKIVDAWYDALDYIRKNPADSIKIMAARTSTPVADYQSFVKGTRLFSSSEGVTAMTKNSNPISLYSTGDGIAKFLIQAEQVTKMPNWAASIEPQFVEAANKKGLGKQPPFDYPKS